MLADLFACGRLDNFNLKASAAHIELVLTDHPEFKLLAGVGKVIQRFNQVRKSLPPFMPANVH